jgi:hypothetical protein
MNKMTKSQAEEKANRLYAKANRFTKYADVGGPESGPRVVAIGWSTKGYRIARRADRISSTYNLGWF